MNVLLTWLTVQMMHTVQTLKVATTVPVLMATLGMDSLAMVSLYYHT